MSPNPNNVRQQLYQARTLVRAIEADGGPPPHLAAQYRSAVDALDTIEHQSSNLGLFPLLLAAVGTIVGILGIVHVGTKLAKGVGGAVDAGASAAKVAAKFVPWLLLAGGGWWLYHAGRRQPARRRARRIKLAKVAAA